MDFNINEPKPEILKNPKRVFPPEKHVVDRNKQDLMNFFNVSTKTKVAATVSALGVLLFLFSIYTGAFQNKQLDTLYPKDQSQASQSGVHTPISGPGFALSGVQTADLSVPYEIKVDVNSGTESASVVAAQLHFDPQFFEAQTILTDESIVTNWIDSNASNSDGVVSLVASFPKGHTAKPGENLAKILFTPKKLGITTLYIDSKNSHIYRMGDKKEVQIQHDQLSVEVK